jgi:uncharacterized protein
MKYNYYTTIVDLEEKGYLYYNAFSNDYLILNTKRHLFLKEHSPLEIERIDKKMYDVLLEGGYIIEDSFDEQIIAEFKKMKAKFSSNQYNVVINTTLDCNLNCWYCYESKIKDSLLKSETIDVIKKNAL